MKTVKTNTGLINTYLSNLIHSPIFEYVRKYFECSDPQLKTIFIFAPYIKTATLDRLLYNIHSKVVIITTWNIHDFQFGSSELELYPYCKKHNISLYVNSDLHLKIYSVNLESAVLATGNITNRGMFVDGNHEAAVKIECLDYKDCLVFEKIRKESNLINDYIYYELKKWVGANPIKKTLEINLEDVIPQVKKDCFLISDLPMTHNVDDLILGYTRIMQGKEPSEDSNTSACIIHDIVNYGINLNLSKNEFVKTLTREFFSHPFIQKINEFIAPEAYFGRIKEWIQNNCTDVPVPSRRELTGNVQVLLEWFEKLGNGEYKIDRPHHSQRIYKIK
ncbi:MAG: hypothetical protein R1F52_07420 [Candidatus Nitrosoabyssus spongiisocia]|nr:MAG: hypothetical protein R1F52_07420 [Nitrosopumilaceae archaeon AB1(1)]